MKTNFVWVWIREWSSAVLPTRVPDGVIRYQEPQKHRITVLHAVHLDGQPSLLGTITIQTEVECKFVHNVDTFPNVPVYNIILQDFCILFRSINILNI